MRTPGLQAQLRCQAAPSCTAETAHMTGSSREFQLHIKLITIVIVIYVIMKHAYAKLLYILEILKVFIAVLK